MEKRISEKDTQLLEIQHRVKNNLQMITALIRIEARNARVELTPHLSIGWPGASNRYSSFMRHYRIMGRERD